MSVDMELGEPECSPYVLRKLRKKHNNTLEDIASVCDVSATLVHYWENGKSNPKKKIGRS